MSHGFKPGISSPRRHAESRVRGSEATRRRAVREHERLRSKLPGVGGDENADHLWAMQHRRPHHLIACRKRDVGIGWRRREHLHRSDESWRALRHAAGADGGVDRDRHGDKRALVHRPHDVAHGVYWRGVGIEVSRRDELHLPPGKLACIGHRGIDREADQQVPVGDHHKAGEPGTSSKKEHEKRKILLQAPHSRLPASHTRECLNFTPDPALEEGRKNTRPADRAVFAYDLISIRVVDISILENEYEH